MSQDSNGLQPRWKMRPRPVIGWTMPATVVNSQSARTTLRATTAMARTSPLDMRHPHMEGGPETGAEQQDGAQDMDPFDPDEGVGHGVGWAF